MTDRKAFDQSSSTPDTPYWRIRHALARVAFLRSGYYLLRAIRDAVRDSPARGLAELNHEFAGHDDPWDYGTVPDQLDRMRREIEVLNAVRGERRFHNVLEAGCAEGIFTEKLAPFCDSLLAVDISPVALGRARQRLAALPSVHFRQCDLRIDRLPSAFDLIVMVHTLEYVRNPFYIRKIRNNLVKSLAPGGYLLLGTMKVADIYENSWWSRFALRSGEKINRFFAAHPALKIVRTEEFHLGPEYIAYDVLLRKHP